MNVDNVFAKIDKWVEDKKGRGWVEPDFIPHDDSMQPWIIHTIQQVRQELHDFVALLFNRNLTNTMVEIGLGRNGGTHRVWREFFNKTLTVEVSMARIKKIQEEFNDERSLFVCGSSQSPKTLEEVKKIVNEIDVLFIDGNHAYNSVRTDWELYNGLVRQGGIVAWHDSECDVNDLYGVGQFLRELEDGYIDGKKHQINRIVHSKKHGIAYENV